MLDKRPVPIQKGTMPRFVECMYAEKLGFAPGEQDLSVMEHRYVVKYKDRSVVRRSTLIDYGTPGGEFSIARLTGLPPAIGAKLILEGRITSKGVISPTLPEVYEPELAELEKHGVRFTEREEEI
jgi:saccharopine dehydrogenase-like NADP-dependent oxidoreductase